MSGAGPETGTGVQLDRSDRATVERAVLSMRRAAEADLRYQLEQRFGLEDPEAVPAGLSEEERARRSSLREAIEREAVDGHGWSKALDLYVQGAGYTVVNRLAALRCLKARGFLERAVTRFRSDGRTPASDPLVEEEFYTLEEAVLEAYGRACDRLAEEVELLFDRGSVYSRLEPRRSAFEELCRTLDEVPDEVWQADDVLGWVYQYYHLEDLDDLRSKAGSGGLDPEDVAPANQFYTPHWVVRMLTDNSLGKLYLEHGGKLKEAVEAQEPLSPEERKGRSLAPEASPTVADLCTYLVPGSEAGSSTEWSDPEELKVIDPACGSGHFLLYAFDVLERIWWAERPDVPRSEVPARILRHNLYGVDIDLRACQLAAFNLYLKARGRAEAEGAREFELPSLNVVCADARVAEFTESEEVFEEVAPEGSRERKALEGILETFRGSYGLGSLLDVKGTLREELHGEQRDAFAAWEGPEELLHGLVKAVEDRRTNGSFLVRDLRSFLRLLEVLAGSYDVALMNPPYGSRSRMPEIVKDYVKQHYEYPPEFYINFFEVCERLLKPHGRVGMIVPQTFMFKRSFLAFRRALLGEQGQFDFLAEYGEGVLDNAIIRTSGSVIRKTDAIGSGSRTGLFIRLHDKPTDEKEEAFLDAVGGRTCEVKRLFRRDVADFTMLKEAPLNYWVPDEIRRTFQSEWTLDAGDSACREKSVGHAKQGTATGNNSRFVRFFWEIPEYEDSWVPYAKGGAQAFILPRVIRIVLWEEEGKEIRRYAGSVIRNDEFYFREGITWPQSKRTGRRFGYLFGNGAFDVKGSSFFPDTESVWSVLGCLNSRLYHYLMLAITPYRDWQVGDIGQLPWRKGVDADSRIAEQTRKLMAIMMELRSSEPTSPNYQGPDVVQALQSDRKVFYDRHPNVQWSTEWRTNGDADGIEHKNNLEDIALWEEELFKERLSAVKRYAYSLDSIVYEKFDVQDDLQSSIAEEISLRTAMSDASAVQQAVGKRGLVSGLQGIPALLHHFVMEVVRADVDGVVPLSPIGNDEELDLLSRVVGEFERIWGEHAEDRLREADEALGDRAPSGGEPYPNLRAWLNEELFDYHTSTFENTPFLWRLTTERLVPEAKGEGFGCVIDYHQLSQSTFDTLRQRYLEARRAALRERRDAADDRQRDASLPAGERQQAQETFERCQSGLEQIEALEATLRELARSRPRDWSEEDRSLAEELAPQVARFRERLETRLQTLDELFEMATDAWLEEVFTPTFRQTVEENRGEWIDALEDLEAACEAYARPAEEPVEAHLYDLFVYFEKLAGSTHYSSNGIFFLNYYFSKGKKYLTEEGSPRPGLQDEERLLAELAAETDADVELGKQVKASCKELARRIPSDWEERALAEVRNAGYRPVKKHGVRINITPLAEARLVPVTVDDRVL